MCLLAQGHPCLQFSALFRECYRLPALLQGLCGATPPIPRSPEAAPVQVTSPIRSGIVEFLLNQHGAGPLLWKVYHAHTRLTQLLLVSANAGTRTGMRSLKSQSTPRSCHQQQVSKKYSPGWPRESVVYHSTPQGPESALRVLPLAGKHEGLC